MADFDYDIGVLGGGSAGLTVTAGAAQLGAKTILIEKDTRLGGDCLHYGCVPSKTLIRTAHVYHLMKNAERFGLPGVRVQPVEFKDVAHRIQHVIGIIQKHDSPKRFCSLGAKVEFGDAVFTDEYTVRVGGKHYTAKNWVLSTGSSPAVPPIEGLDKTPFLTNRDVYSFEKLPGSMIIFGAGPIGIEMSQAFTRLGTKVTVVQRAGQILSREDKDMADMVMSVLSKEGVTFHLNSTILNTKDLGNEKEVIIRTSEGNTVSLRAEHIMVAVGRSANVDGLGLEKIGLDFDHKGIKTDRRLRTSQKHIYAAGDVTGQYLFTHAAGYEGGVIISNTMFHLPKRTDYTFLPWCTYTDPELASIGMNEKRAIEAGIEHSVWTEEFRMNDRSLAEGEELGRIKMLLDDKKKPLGVQIFGPQAGELMSEWVAVTSAKVKLTTIASAIHPYPTLGEMNKRVITNYIADMLYSDKVRKGLKFFFSLKGRACKAK